jgi:hypothetical protein
MMKPGEQAMISDLVLLQDFGQFSGHFNANINHLIFDLPALPFYGATAVLLREGVVVLTVWTMIHSRG